MSAIPPTINPSGTSRRGGRWWSTLKEKATDVAANAVTRGLGWIATSFILPFLSSRYVPGLIGRFLKASIILSIPWWTVISSALLATGIAVTIWARFRSSRKAATALKAEIAALRADISRREWRAQTFSWSGVEWPLTENFWGYVLRTSAEDFDTGDASPSMLNGAIGDPLCANPKCRQEVWPSAASGMCPCGSRFELGLTLGKVKVSSEDRLRLKRGAYRDARAEYFRRQWSPPS
jgi:hypothetical protein